MMRIKNGLVIDPANGIKRQADVLVKDGKIERILDRDNGDSINNECDVIDAAGCIVAPGLVLDLIHIGR